LDLWIRLIEPLLEIEMIIETMLKGHKPYIELEKKRFKVGGGLVKSRRVNER
jgi:hypothetical protein